MSFNKLKLIASATILSAVLVSCGVNTADDSTSTNPSVDPSTSGTTVTTPTETTETKVDLAAVIAWVKQQLPSSTSYSVTLPTLYTDGVTTISYSSSNTAVFSNTGEVTRQSTDVNITLTITVTNNGETEIGTDTITINKLESGVDYITIKSALAKSTGTDVVIQGIVTKSYADGFYIQDNTGSLFVYKGTGVSVGAEAKVSATVSEYNQAKQLIDSTSTTISSNNTLPPAATISSINSSTLTANMFGRVTIEDLTIKSMTAYDSTSDYSFTVSDGTNETLVFAKRTIDDDSKTALDTLLGIATVGSTIHLNEITVSSYKGTPQLIVIDNDELVLGDLTTQQKYDAVLASIKHITDLNNDTITGSLTLPTTSLYGSTIKWSSNNTSAISNTGVVTRPAEGSANITATLTYEITLEGTTYPKGTVNLTILAEQGGLTNLGEYYDGINTSSTGSTLRTALKNLITETHNYRGYGSSYNSPLSIGARTESDPNKMTLFYTGSLTSLSEAGGGNTSTWNKEHVYPKSKTSSATENDIHNIRPTGTSINSTRSNLAFGENLSTKVTDSNFPYAAGSTFCYKSSSAFEPRDEVKGDAARIIFYTALRHGESIDSGIGSLDMFKRWNDADPVDRWEMNMNDAIEDFQGNRNPFIDNSEWVEELF